MKKKYGAYIVLRTDGFIVVLPLVKNGLAPLMFCWREANSRGAFLIGRAKQLPNYFFIIMVWLKKIDWIDFVSLSLIFSPSLKPVALNTL